MSKAWNVIKLTPSCSYGRAELRSPKGNAVLLCRNIMTDCKSRLGARVYIYCFCLDTHIPAELLKEHVPMEVTRCCANLQNNSLSYQTRWITFKQEFKCFSPSWSKGLKGRGERGWIGKNPLNVVTADALKHTWIKTTDHYQSSYKEALIDLEHCVTPCVSGIGTQTQALEQLGIRVSPVAGEVTAKPLWYCNPHLDVSQDYTCAGGLDARNGRCACVELGLTRRNALLELNKILLVCRAMCTLAEVPGLDHGK